MGKAAPKNTIVQFANRKLSYEGLNKKFDFHKIDNTNLDLQPGTVVYSSENLSP